MTSKIQFINKATDALTDLALLQEKITGLAGVFTARGYQVGGTDPIVDADMTGSESKLTAAQLQTILVPILSEYLSFCNNLAVATKDRKSDMNKARKDI